MKTTQLIEALLFASDAPLGADDLARATEELDRDGVLEAIETLRAEYEATGRAFQLYEIAGGYQLLTRPEYSPHVERFETVPGTSRLSSAALEVLAIVAYRQPIGRAEIEEIRGVDSTHVLRSLQDVALLEVVDRGEGLGRPLLYGTTSRFLEHFGFASLDDLPRPDELPVVLTERHVEPGPSAPPDVGEPDPSAPPDGGEPGPSAPPDGGEPDPSAPPDGGEPGPSTPPDVGEPDPSAPPGGGEEGGGEGVPGATPTPERP